MTSSRQLCREYYTCVLLTARANEENEAAALRDSGDHTAGSSQVGRGHVKRDDVDTLPDTEDVTRVGRVPEGGRMAQVRLRCE